MGGRPILMSTHETLGGVLVVSDQSRPSSKGVRFMPMNFGQSETIWTLCQQELLDRNLRPDVILVQDPPFFVYVGKFVFVD